MSKKFGWKKYVKMVKNKYTKKFPYASDEMKSAFKRVIKKRKKRMTSKKKKTNLKFLPQIMLQYIVYKYNGKLYQHKFKKDGDVFLGKNYIKVVFPYDLNFNSTRGFLN